MQLTISFYLFGFAVAQVFYGPLSDRHGRKPVLMVALSIYLVATLACALAPTIETLIAARFLQAVGISGSIVLARAVVRRVVRRLTLWDARAAQAKLYPPPLARAIVDDGTTVFDSNAILLYLAEKTGQFLPGTSLKARGEMLSWLMFVASGIGPYSGQAVHFRNFAPEPKEYAVTRYTFEATRHWNILNDRLAKVCAANPKRFAAFAASRAVRNPANAVISQTLR